MKEIFQELLKRTSIVFIIVGAILFLFGVAGGIVTGAFTLQISDNVGRVATTLIGLAVVGFGIYLAWLEQRQSHEESKDTTTRGKRETVSDSLFWGQVVGGKVSITWEQVMQILRRLGVKIRSEPFVPDVVVGVAREGSIVASTFAYNERYKPFCVLERQKLEPVRMKDTVPTNIIEGKKVLLIDSECNREGGTLREAKDFLLSKKFAAEVRTMVLGKSVRSSFKLDYVAFEYLERPEWPWLYTAEVKERRKEHDELIKSRQ